MSSLRTEVIVTVMGLASVAALVWSAYMLAPNPSARRCVERDIPTISAAHRDAWSAAFDRRGLTDRELAGLADAQAMLDCLERAP